MTLRPPADAAAPTVLVVPAMGMGARWYRPLLEALAACGLGAAVTELRGHEEDAPPAGRRRDHGYADLVADLDTTVRALTDHLGRAPYLLGHSLGGQVACALLAQRPDAAPGLVLVASGSVHWRLWSPRFWLLTQGAAVLARVRGHFPGHRFGFAGREAPTQMVDWARFARTGRMRFRGLDGRRSDHTAALAEVRLPVLAVTLAGDGLAPPRSSDGLLAWLTAARVERRHLDPAAAGHTGVDHLRWVRTPASVVPLLADWLGRTEAARAGNGTSP